jgi:hypothetical protein
MASSEFASLASFVTRTPPIARQDVLRQVGSQAIAEVFRKLMTIIRGRSFFTALHFFHGSQCKARSRNLAQESGRTGR